MPRLDVAAVKKTVPEEVYKPPVRAKKKATRRKTVSATAGDVITPEDLAKLKASILSDVSDMQAAQAEREQQLKDENDDLKKELAELKAQMTGKKAPLPSNDNVTTPAITTDTTAGRMEIVMRGAKQGAIKGAVDKTVGMISGPLADSIVEKLLEANPKLAVAGDPIIRAVLNFAFIMGIAELLHYAGPMTGREKMAKKSELLSRWMRSYAGEKLGEEAIEAAFQAVPLVMQSFSDISMEDLEMVLADEDNPVELELPEEDLVPAI